MSDIKLFGIGSSKVVELTGTTDTIEKSDNLRANLNSALTLRTASCICLVRPPCDSRNRRSVKSPEAYLNPWARPYL